MEDGHTFRVVAWWTSGQAGIAKSDLAPSAIHFTSPPAFGGLEGRWTPEELLLCAVASGYTTTFSALAEESELHYSDLEVEVEGQFYGSDSGYVFSEILIRPKLTLTSTEEAQCAHVDALRLLRIAQAACPIARALAVERKFEPRVLVGKSRVENTQPSLAIK